MEKIEAYEKWSQAIEEACQEVFKELGTDKGVTEYEDRLEQVLRQRNLQVARNTSIPLSFLHHQVEEQFPVALLIEGEILLEVPEIRHQADYLAVQLETSLQLTGKRIGYLAVFENGSAHFPRRLENPPS